MTCRPFETNAPKRSANLSVNSELLRQARALNINLSELLEQRLIEVICEHRRRV